MLCSIFTNILKTYAEIILNVDIHLENKTYVIHFVLARKNLDIHEVLLTIPVDQF